MDDRQHKAHRPAQSGGKAAKKEKEKGKEKQKGFNEKARTSSDCLRLLTRIIIRHSLRNQEGRRNVKDDEMPRRTRPVFMFPS